MKQIVQELISSDWWSPEQILKLLRMIKKGDILELAKHPIANSNIVQLYLNQQGLKDTPYNVGLAISGLVTLILSNKLEQLRASSGQYYNIEADKEDLKADDPLIRIDAQSNNREIIKWSLLVRHYVYNTSIPKLTKYFDYSPRQVLYYIREARYDVSKILLEQERNQTAVIDIHAPIEQKRKLSKEEQEHFLSSLDFAYSAPCSAFLWGDWSALASKRAIIAPLNKRVSVGVKSNNNKVSCQIYEWYDSDNRWVFNERHSTKMTDIISKSWQYLSKLLNLVPVDIYVFSDVHFGYGIHESSAMFAALASCMSSYLEGDNAWKKQLPRLAFIMESFWYPEITGATTICAFQSPNYPSVMVLDRTNDGNIDFKQIADKNVAELEKNRAIDPMTFNIQWLDFDVTKLIILLHRFVEADLGEIHKAYIRNLSRLNRVGFGYLCDIMQENINSLDYEKIGAMMNLHQALLSISAFAPPGLHEILRKLRTIHSIFGVKPSCSRPHGAYIALIEGDPIDIVQYLPEWIHPISTFVTPTPGIQSIPTHKAIAHDHAIM